MKLHEIRRCFKKYLTAEIIYFFFSAFSASSAVKSYVSFSIRPAVFRASGDARMKLRLAETMDGLNVEHRTSNIERRILTTLRFID